MEKLNTLSRWLDHKDRSLDSKNIVLLYSKLLTIYILEKVKLKGLKKELLSEIQCSDRTGDQEEPVAKAVYELW